MSLYILDTDTLTLAERGQRDVSRRILAIDPSQLAITVISIEEQLTGWYTLLRRTKDPAKLDAFTCDWRRLSPTLADGRSCPLPRPPSTAVPSCES